MSDLWLTERVQGQRRYHRLGVDRHTILCECSQLGTVGYSCSVPFADRHLTNQSPMPNVANISSVSGSG